MVWSMVVIIMVDIMALPGTRNQVSTVASNAPSTPAENQLCINASTLLSLPSGSAGAFSTSVITDESVVSAPIYLSSLSGPEYFAERRSTSAFAAQNRSDLCTARLNTLLDFFEWSKSKWKKSYSPFKSSTGKLSR